MHLFAGIILTDLLSKTDVYKRQVEDVAKEKLGLVHENEIIFKAE